jgi:hypothetical protein
MFHDRRQRHVERLRQRADGKVGLFGEPRQQRTPGRVGEGGKGTIERGGAKLNHMVKYRSGGGRMSTGLLNPSYGLLMTARTSLMASALDHSAGPAISPISQPERSTISVVGMPKALPAIFKS